MSNQLKIKLSIADRVYPITTQPELEEGLRKAAKKIEAMIGQFEQSYSVRDKQDVLAMCALQLGAQVEQKIINNDQVNTDLKDQLDALNQRLQPFV